MLHEVERPFERIFFILGIQRSYFNDVAEVMFLVGEWPRELVISILDISINDFDDVDEAIFQSV
jgi:hypothetical protein